MDIEENDTILCTVKRIEGTTVFLEMPGGTEGTMIFSEVAAGRIRNIREYIVPNKKVVCKVLRIKNKHVELSLRRVTGKEKEQIQEEYKKERQFKSMLKPVLGNKTLEIFKKIKSSYDIPEFIESSKKDIKLLENFMSKEESKKIFKIITEKKETEKQVKKTISLKTKSPSGIKEIKKILDSKGVQIKYKGSSNFTISAKANDFKIANQILEKALNEIKEKAKKFNAKLEIK